MKFLVQRTCVWLAITFFVPQINAMEKSVYCLGGSDSGSGCKSTHQLSDNSYHNFKGLIEKKEYQAIENACVKKTVKIAHYLSHTSIEYIQDVFKDIVNLGDKLETQTYTSGSIRVDNGLFRYVLKRVAARVFNTNIDTSTDMIRNIRESDREQFRPSQLSSEEFVKFKHIYLDQAEAPAFIIRPIDLELYLGQKFIKKDSFWWFDFYDKKYLEKLEDCLADISDHWLTLNRYYSLIDQLKSYELKEIKQIVKLTNKRSIISIVLKFISAYVYKENLTEENCVEIVEQIQKYLKKSRKDHFYGLLVVSDQYPSLPYLIIALFQQNCECPLVINNIIDHPCKQNNAKCCSNFTKGNSKNSVGSIGGTYEFPEKVFLAIKGYDWIEYEQCYKIGALVFREFDELWISFGPWSCSPL